jgi:hypothetical protein
MKKLARNIKNSQFDEVEVDVREATSSSKDEPSEQLLCRIQIAGLDPHKYSKLFAMLWRRITDTDHPRHVHKVQTLLFWGADGSSLC